MISFGRKNIEIYQFSVQFDLNLRFNRLLNVRQRNNMGNSLISLWIGKISIYKSTTFSCHLSTIYKLLWLKNWYTIYNFFTPSVYILQAKFRPNLQSTFRHHPPLNTFFSTMFDVDFVWLFSLFNYISVKYFNLKLSHFIILHCI